MSPSTSGYSNAVAWHEAFWPLCTDCKIDAAQIHWYGTYTSDSSVQQLLSELQSEMAKTNAKTQLPLWLTEFGLFGSPPDAFVSQFLTAAIPWLESTSYMSKYAWFEAEVSPVLSFSLSFSLRPSLFLAVEHADPLLFLWVCSKLALQPV